MRNNTTQIFTEPNHAIIILQKKSTIYKKNIFFNLVGPLNRIKVDSMLFDRCPMLLIEHLSTSLCNKVLIPGFHYVSVKFKVKEPIEIFQFESFLFR